MVIKYLRLNKHIFVPAGVSFLFYVFCLLFLMNRGLHPLNVQRLLFITVTYTGILVAFFILSFVKPDLSFWDKLYRYRYLLAGYFLLLLVAQEIHGSSMATWNHILQGDDIINTLFGNYRPIRSDEWAVHTMFALSQYTDPNHFFPYFSNIIRGTSTDVFIVYGQPVWDVVVLFRPFQWGYLLLSPARGLSFFWLSRLIALFMVSFEMGMLVTGKRKQLSVAFAFMVCFAPAVQWWFSAVTLVEMFVFGQLFVIFLNKYIQTNSQKYRCIYALLMGWLGMAFILTFYPPWQIPLGYIFAALVVWVITENYHKNMINKRDCWNILLFLSVLVLGLGRVFSQSRDTIITVMNTAYPGNRVSAGGGVALDIFTSVGNIFLPYLSASPPGNQCERALFFDLFPISFVIIFVVLFIQKKKDKLLIILLITFAFLFSWCFLPWSDWLYMITFLNVSPPFRTIGIFGFLNLLLLFRAVSLFEYKIKISYTIIISIIVAARIVTISKRFYQGYLTTEHTIISFIILFVLFLLVLNINKFINKKVFVLCIVILMLVMGGTVNPVEQGVGAILDQPIVQSIKEIQQRENGLWLVESVNNFPINNIPIVAGAPTINSTNVYPYLERWQLLDPENKYEYLYNRYAHINVTIQNEFETTFQLLHPDAIRVYINVRDLKKLNVSYIVSGRDLHVLNDENIVFEFIEFVQGLWIYRIR
jgi:hypothetical protein